MTDGLAPPPPPEKKKMSGCLIAFLVFAALAVLGIGFLAFGVYQFSQTKEGKEVLNVIGEAKELGEKAAAAPGAAEARAAGCTLAMIADRKDLQKLGQLSASKPAADAPSQLVLLCMVDRGAPQPACEKLAEVYRKAPGASPAPIFVVVVEQMKRGFACRGLFDASGARLPDPPGLD